MWIEGKDDFFDSVALCNADPHQLASFYEALRRLAEDLDVAWNGEVWHDVKNSQGLSSWDLYQNGKMAEQVAFGFAPRVRSGNSGDHSVLVNSTQPLSQILAHVSGSLTLPPKPSPFRVVIGRDNA